MKPKNSLVAVYKELTLFEKQRYLFNKIRDTFMNHDNVGRARTKDSFQPSKQPTVILFEWSKLVGHIRPMRESRTEKRASIFLFFVCTIHNSSIMR